ncbi:ammonium transporter [Sphingomonas sp.]|uniref:ammonium transporter n=1 Tax=Sphingomonas sp. TaxID=28214 RepID=UPI0025DC622F|nr:ammonium transporter [Sphingomonas sp.]
MTTLSRYALTTLGISLATVAQAQPIVVADSGDSAWVLAASALGLIAALPGLALLHGRRDGVHGPAIVLSAAIATLVFAALGYSLAFSEGGSIIGGADNAMLANMAEMHADLTISDIVFALYQLTVALFAVGIMVSSIAHRARIGWLGGFVAVWSLIVYAPVAHWIWGGGWLSDLGVLDFGGGLVVQVAAGTATLVAALLIGRGGIDDDAAEAVTVTVTGAGAVPALRHAGLALTLVGWIGILGGAAFGGGDDAATAMLNGLLAASAAVLVGFAIARWRESPGGDDGVATAAIAGLAAISTGAAFVGPAGAMALGVGGALAAWAGSVLVRQLNVGTTASAFVASGCGGIVGAVAFPLFVSPIFGGPGFDEGVGLLTQTVAQGVGVLVVILWSAVVTAIAALMVSMIAPMRVAGRFE